ncbi:hypothetical protein [Streptomyces sp. TLI_171]|uniref:hypothetical protein n=1 Tax=Streptomyces sp. TLI_171 TaxID=1938859 RepID=UPI000C367AE4|nr:hypothetical protein [Streptomyces sp. TLI_171]RKE05002.1 hypothetical protein BX266_7241 [Streptomyces sp. TLI_171]
MSAANRSNALVTVAIPSTSDGLCPPTRRIGAISSAMSPIRNWNRLISSTSPRPSATSSSYRSCETAPIISDIQTTRPNPARGAYTFADDRPQPVARISANSPAG